jgi:type I restriction enzyme R subunit
MRAESERITRKDRIDPKLSASGWSVVPFVSVEACASLHDSAVEEYETDLGPADYVLTDRSQLLGVVEAKKLTVGPQGVLPQAERYARAIPSDVPYQGEFGVPFLYSTNGEKIWFHDVRHPLSRSREVAAFHTVKAMREMLERDVEAEEAALRAIPLHESIRPYQVEANTAIEQAIADRHRKMLVTMATGTGKTLMTVNEIHRLMRSGVARRVLFLVDRRALAAQTVRSRTGLPDPSALR